MLGTSIQAQRLSSGSAYAAPSSPTATQNRPPQTAAIPFDPKAGSEAITRQSPTSLSALVSTGLKVGVAALGVMIGAAGLTGCATPGSSYQGPSYSEYHRATLTWEAPTGNTDGTSFHDEDGDGRVDGVRGYIVYRGDAPRSPGGDYQEARELTRPDCSSQGARTLCTYAWENLPSGTHYFSVKAWKEVPSGTRHISDYSNEASKTIP